MTVTFDGNIWLRERSVLVVDTETSQQETIGVAILIGGTSRISFEYKTDLNGVAKIDLSDAFRILKSQGSNSGAINVTFESTAQSASWVVKGLANPAGMIIPALDGVGKKMLNYDDDILIAPPTRILSAGEQMAFSWFSTDSAFPLGALKWRVYTATSYVNKGVITQDIIIPSNAKRIAFMNSAQTLTIAYINIVTECGNVADVQWTDIAGRNKRFGWLIQKGGFDVMDRTDMQTILNDYNVRKGYTTGGVLRLTNLSPYDYWYYSDIILSDSVTVNGQAVDIVTSSIQQPDGNEWNTLEVEFKYKRYDQV